MTGSLKFLMHVFGDKYKFFFDGEGNELKHPFSDTAVVKPFETDFCTGTLEILRNVMLYSYQDRQFAVIDPNRHQMPLQVALVAVYPQVEDRVFVKGEGESI